MSRCRYGDPPACKLDLTNEVRCGAFEAFVTTGVENEQDPKEVAMNRCQAGLYILLSLIVFVIGCRTPTVREAAPTGALAILKQLEAYPEDRTIALEGDIRGASHPPCSLMEAFLEALEKKPAGKVQLVERDLLDEIRLEFERNTWDVFDTQSRAKLGELLRANTVVIGWGGEQKEEVFSTNSAGAQVLEDEFWFTTYLHLVAIDIPTGCVIAAWSYYRDTPSQVARRLSPWIEPGDTVVVQPSLDDEVKSALIAGLYTGSQGAHKVAVRDLLQLLARETRKQASDFFSSTNQDRLRLAGASVIIGADSVMGMNLRAIDVQSGVIRGGLAGPLSRHITTSHYDPKISWL